MLRLAELGGFLDLSDFMEANRTRNFISAA
jgi:hypothetical protein